MLICDARTGQPAQTLQAMNPTAACFSSDARQLAVCHWGDLDVVDLLRNEVVFRWKSVGIQDVSWSPNARLLAVVGSAEPSDAGWLALAGWVYVFDTVKRERAWKLHHGTKPVALTAVTWSLDGQRLVSGDNDGLAEVWDVSRGRKVVSAPLHTARINTLACSPDGRRMASGSTDRTVRVWDPARGEELLRLDVPNAEVTQCRWSPDGRLLAASGADGAILIWDASAGYDFLNSQESVREQMRAQQDEAMKLWGTDRKADAIPLLTRLLETLKTTLGPDHVETVRCMLRLAHSYELVGRFTDAVALFEQVLAKVKAMPEPEASLTLQLMTDLAAAYQNVGRFDRAEALLVYALAQRRKVDCPCPQSDVWRVLIGLAVNHLKRHQYAAAEPLLRECLRIFDQMAANDRETPLTESLLGASLLGQKKYAEAETLLLAGYEGLKQREETTSPLHKYRLTEAIERLVQLYEAWAKPEKAAEWRAKLPAAAGGLRTDVFARPKAAGDEPSAKEAIDRPMNPRSPAAGG
jgi:hypothetical protein